MNSINCFKRNNNKNGYTVMFIMIVLVLVVFWSLIEGSELIVHVANEQKSEMKKSGIVVNMKELPEFKLKN